MLTLVDRICIVLWSVEILVNFWVGAAALVLAVRIWQSSRPRQ